MLKHSVLAEEQQNIIILQSNTVAVRATNKPRCQSYQIVYCQCLHSYALQSSVLLSIVILFLKLLKSLCVLHRSSVSCY